MLLDIRDLSVHYFAREAAVRAVDRLSLSVSEGETFGIVGESGSGKSTLGLSIMRLVPSPGRIVAGEIRFDGSDLLSLKEEELRGIRGKKIAMIFQDPMTSLNPVMNIKDHFVEMIRTHSPSVPSSTALSMVEEMAEELGIAEDRLREFPHQFSGGMRQRVMIGLALILRPRLVIADEPTTALDVLVEAQILELMRRLREAYRLTLILITHNMGVVAQTADRVAVMYAGQVVEVGDRYQIFERPLHPYTQLLLAAVPNIMVEKKLEAIPGSPPDLASPPPACRFHPRCPYAFERCRVEEPELKNTGEGRLVACHLYD